MKLFLQRTDVIDWDVPEVRALASSIGGSGSDLEVAKRCFDWVRDDVSHSFDAAAACVTCSASQTLRERTGICYSKTHLLAALLRANSIPTGFGYQRVALDEHATAFCLHGFNYVHLDDYGWCPADPRGNREGISTVFAPPKESLAFAGNLPGECTFRMVFADPLPSILNCLADSGSVEELRLGLPDWDAEQREAYRASDKIAIDLPEN
jgi:transglutaminase-like putative cysteine protease